MKEQNGVIGMKAVSVDNETTGKTGKGYKNE